MNVILVGLNHETAPVEVREQLAVAEKQLGDALARLRALPGITEGLILSTCNRVEVYAVAQETDDGFERVRQFLLSLHPSLTMAALEPHLYSYAAADAIRHLFRVASSLDSMVVGEPQILGQLKDAFEAAMAHRTTGLVLNKLVSRALSAAKRVRTETKIAENAVSVSFAGVQLAKKIFGRLEETSVLLIGAGEMAELAARHLVALGVRRVVICSRHQERAARVAAEFQGQAFGLDQAVPQMEQSDIVLCSTGATHYLVQYDDVRRVIHLRKNRPIFFIDLSVPRNIDPRINEIDNVFLYDIDDLQQVVEANRRERAKEAERAEPIIAAELDSAVRWLKSLDVVPTIVALREKAEAIRQAEMERLIGRVKTLSPDQVEAIERFADSLVKKLLHSPFAALKQEADSANGSLYIEAARRLFQLDPSKPPQESAAESPAEPESSKEKG
ncbi:MAG: glutamyl-tRNA reductase [Nitrospirota bacterium]